MAEDFLLHRKIRQHGASAKLQLDNISGWMLSPLDEELLTPRRKTAGNQWLPQIR